MQKKVMRGDLYNSELKKLIIYHQIFLLEAISKKELLFFDIASISRNTEYAAR
jgi:hypothetical protein